MQLEDDGITQLLQALQLQPTSDQIGRVRTLLRTGRVFPIHRLGIGGDGLAVRWIEDGDDVGARAPTGAWVSSEQSSVIAIEGESIVGVVLAGTLVLGVRTARRWRALSFEDLTS